MIDTSTVIRGYKPIVVAKEVYAAAISDNYCLRNPIVGGAVPTLFIQKILPDR